MPRRLPPLNTLRVFESAARHMSFTKAAEELAVTQAAVSHSIRSLEDWLQVPVFRRLGRGLELTDAGRQLEPAVRDALDALAATTDRIRRAEESRSLAVSVQISLASNWLVPRLYRFQEANPEIDVWVTANDRSVDLARDPVDLGVRNGPGGYVELDVVEIMREEMFPVCSPGFLEAHPELRSPADLCGLPLLWDEYPSIAPGPEGGRIRWGDWFTAAGLDGYRPPSATSISHASIVVQMAAQGRGVALARTAIALEALSTGRLVKLFPISIPAIWSYWAVSLPGAARPGSRLALFRDWLMEEGQVTMDQARRVEPVLG